LSIAKQCQLLGLPKSSLYYQPCEIDSGDLSAMHMIDQEYTAHPFYGRLIYLGDRRRKAAKKLSDNYKKAMQIIEEMTLINMNLLKNDAVD
jgi:hypothetical protein